MLTNLDSFYDYELIHYLSCYELTVSVELMSNIDMLFYSI